MQFANEALELAESKGMGGYLDRAKKLLAQINTCTNPSDD